MKSAQQLAWGSLHRLSMGERTTDNTGLSERDMLPNVRYRKRTLSAPRSQTACTTNPNPQARNHAQARGANQRFGPFCGSARSIRRVICL